MHVLLCRLDIDLYIMTAHILRYFLLGASARSETSDVGKAAQ